MAKKNKKKNSNFIIKETAQNLMLQEKIGIVVVLRYGGEDLALT